MRADQFAIPKCELGLNKRVGNLGSVTRKRQRTAALHNLADGVACEKTRQSLGVRLSSAAFSKCEVRGLRRRCRFGRCRENSRRLYLPFGKQHRES
jgi:hypothetical protein